METRIIVTQASPKGGGTPAGDAAGRAKVFDVKVSGKRATSHRVRVSNDYHAKLARPNEAPESLIRRSFEFLLAREPNTSILADFDLSVISRYFPEYETVIR